MSAAAGRGVTRARARLAELVRRMRAPFTWRICHARLLPDNDIVVEEGRYRSTGRDPHFTLEFEAGDTPGGWVLVSYRAAIGFADAAFAPALYVDAGQGYSERDTVRLGRHLSGRQRRIVRLPEGVIALRFDPLDVDPLRSYAVPRGPFEVDDFRIAKLGGAVLVALCTLGVLRALAAAPRPVLVRLSAALRMVMGGRGEAAGGVCVAIVNRVYQPLLSLTQWFSDYRRTYDALPAYSPAADAPRFSVLLWMDGCSVRDVMRAVHSLRCQTHDRWELLCVARAASVWIRLLLRWYAHIDDRVDEEYVAVSRASLGEVLDRAAGEFVLELAGGDALEPRALQRLAEAITAQGCDLAYGDEVVLAGDGRTVAAITARPAFSCDYFIRHPYIAQGVAVRTERARQAADGFDRGARLGDTAVLLRALEPGGRATHVADILYRRRRADDKSPLVEPETVRGHLRLRGYADAGVTSGGGSGCLSVRYHAPTARSVAVIIPTRNKGALLHTCIESMKATAGENSLGFWVVDHESDEPQTRAYLDALGATERIIPYAGPFNFARMNNLAAAAVGSDYEFLLFINNDVEARAPGWLDSMLDNAACADVGAVGATLLYPDGRIQHAGVVLGLLGSAEHLHKGTMHEPAAHRCGPLWQNAPLVTRELSAVTAACMLVRREVFQRLGGFDEGLAVGFNDIDFCLRLRDQGYRVLCDAEAVLVHHESASRGTVEGDPHPEDSRIFNQRYGDLLERGDPYFHPLLSRRAPECRFAWGRTAQQHAAYRTVVNPCAIDGGVRA